MYQLIGRGLELIGFDIYRIIIIYHVSAFCWVQRTRALDSSFALTNLLLTILLLNSWCYLYLVLFYLFLFTIMYSTYNNKDRSPFYLLD